MTDLLAAARSRILSTRAIHAGQEPDPTTGAVIGADLPDRRPTRRRRSARTKASSTRAPTTRRARRSKRNLAVARGRAPRAVASPRGSRPRTRSCRRCPPATTWSAGNNTYGGTYRLFDKVWRRHGSRVHVRRLRATPRGGRGGVHVPTPSWCSSRPPPTRSCSSPTSPRSATRAHRRGIRGRSWTTPS